MAPDPADIHSLIPNLSELELAILICLVADRHLIVRAPDDELEEVQKDIKAIALNTFGFTFTSLECSQSTNLDDLSSAVMEEETSQPSTNGVCSAPC